MARRVEMDQVLLGAWTKDDKGFFYTRYDQPARGAEFQASNFNNKLCYHRLGTPQSADVLVYWRPEHPEWLYGAEVTEDGRWLVICDQLGKGREQPRSGPRSDRALRHAGRVGRQFRAPVQLRRQRRPECSSSRPTPTPRGAGWWPSTSTSPSPADWREIIPQSEATLTQVSFVGDRFIACYLKDVVSQVKVFSIDGQPIGDVALPGVGAAAGFGGKRTDKETFYTFFSITTPPSIYRYDIATGESRLVAPGRSEVQPGRLRDEASLLPQQGRHADSDVHRP